MRGIMVLILGLLPVVAGAQDPRDSGDREPWRTSWFPYIGGRSNDGPMLAVQFRHWEPAPYDARVTFAGALTTNAGITAHGTRFARAEFDAPLLWTGWRLRTAASADREARLGYFGLGNGATYDGDLVTAAQPFVYRVRRTRYRAHAEVSRSLAGPRFLVALLGDLESSRFTPLPGPSLFQADFGGAALKEDDASARVALVYDTRDVEYDTHQGMLLETGAQVASGGGNYTRLYAVLRGYLPVREGTIVAARLAGSGMGGIPTLTARYTIPAWNDAIPVLGGELSHRALDTGRLAGRHVLFGNLEIRQDILNLGDYGALTLLAFVDAGRVFETESFAFTTDDLKVGGGGGVAVRILRSTTFTFNFAGGPDGFNFSVGNGWMF